jgi:hypothetical protein
MSKLNWVEKYLLSVEKPNGERRLRNWDKWEDNIKIDLRERSCDTKWFELA